jgi:hypothetical protein
MFFVREYTACLIVALAGAALLFAACGVFFLVKAGCCRALDAWHQWASRKMFFRRASQALSHR